MSGTRAAIIALLVTTGLPATASSAEFVVSPAVVNENVLLILQGAPSLGAGGLLRWYLLHVLLMPLLLGIFFFVHYYKVVLHGLSLGSGVAAKLATEVAAKALILEAPYTAIVDIAGERFWWLPVRFLMRDQFLTRERIGKVRMPVLMAHGTRDSVIPYTHVERLFMLAPEPKILARMIGSDHATLVRDGIYEQHIWPFLARL